MDTKSIRHRLSDSGSKLVVTDPDTAGRFDPEWAPELLVVGLWLTTGIGFLWFNLIGCAAVLVLSVALDASAPA